MRHEVIDRALDRMFRMVLDRAQGYIALRRVVVSVNARFQTLRLRGEFAVDGNRSAEYNAEISQRVIQECSRDATVVPRFPAHNFDYPHANEIWSRCFEDHYIRKLERSGRAAAERALGRGNHDAAREIYERTRVMVEHDSRHHSRVREFESRFWADASPADFDRYTIRSEMIDAAAARLQRDLERQIMGAFPPGEESTATVTSADTSASTITIEALRRAAAALRDADYPQLDRQWVRNFFYDRGGIDYGGVQWFEFPTVEVGTPEAQARGLELFRAGLTEAQRAEYDRERAFRVRGGMTGKQYRIKHGRQMNIEELDAAGNRVCGWCFLPKGGLVAGDIMLAQKLALELYEEEALRVANRFA